MTSRIAKRAATLMLAALAAAAGIAPITAVAQAARQAMPLGVFPPWQGGRNNDSLHRGLEFTIPQVDNLADFHGNPGTAQLVLYVAGNYYFAMAPLVQAFERQHPQYRGKLYWETIPPGLLQTQMQAGGTITVGNMTWTAPPDVYMAGLGRVKKMVQEGALEAPVVPFVTNDLTIMVPKGNPAHIRSLADLARADVKLAMPNPAFEGIGKRIEKALVKAGGPELLKAVYTDKVKAGSTELTHIHHRQTPLWIMQGRVQGGVTWQSEARFQEMAGHPIAHVAIPAAHNVTAIYAGAIVRGAPHAEAARDWLTFSIRHRRWPSSNATASRRTMPKRAEAHGEQVMTISTGWRSLAAWAALLTIAMAICGVAGAQTPDAAKIATMGNGRGAAPCSACHGDHGGGQDAAGYPRLAGLDKAYLLKQLNDFASGARSNPVMQPNAKTLSVAEREAMAAYYSAMPVPAAAQHRDAKPVPDDDPGARLALQGRWSDKLPACVQCHGPHGVGVGANFPPLTGQPANYLIAQLNGWKQGLRSNDPLQLMQHVSSALSESDIRHVAAWFAAQPIDAKGATP